VEGTPVMSERSYDDLKADAKRLGIKIHGVKRDDLAELVDVGLAKGERRPVGTPEELEAARDFDSGDRVAVTRVNGKGAWWCPVCDHSNHSLMRECGGCGAVHEGDEVVAP
jgi:hypothetical protein